MPLTNIPTADQIPYPDPALNLQPVKIINAWATSSTENSQGVNVILDAENIKWTSKGRGQSIFMDIGTEQITIKRMLIEWDPALARTGHFEIEFILSPATPEGDPEVKDKTFDGQQDTSLFTLLEDPDGAKARAIRIRCFGNDGYNADDNNGISNVKLWSASVQ